MSSNSSTVFTCVTCNVAFSNSELQREHYKTDWHRYNLKRKVAELPIVSIQDFADRVKLQKEQETSQEKKTDELFCKLCSKHFTTLNSFSNHRQSKKHKDLEASISETTKQTSNEENIAMVVNENKDEFIVKSDRALKKAELKENTLQESELAEDETSWEDIADEEIEEFDESKGIDLLTCFFCDHKSESVEAKCDHMAKEHSFFLPDTEHLTDVEGLIKFLGIKLGAYHVCLWCSSKCYKDLLSVQKHMIDKGHQKIKFEGETLLEYVDFYTYEDDDSDEDYDMLNYSDLNSESRVSILSNNSLNRSILEDSNYELVLPSGARIGHRSLLKYYKQSFGHRSLELKQRNNVTIKDKYRAIATNGTYTQTEIKKQRKDLAYFQRWSAKMHAKLGWETNKLQKHYRRQDITF